MYLAFDYPSRTSSGGGASYECLYVCSSSGACVIWENEFDKHPAPLALRNQNVFQLSFIIILFN